MQPLEVSALQALVDGHVGRQQPLTLLDVREPWEVALGRIELKGAQTVAIPMNTIPGRLEELNPSQTVVCVCHHGMRSAQVAAFLEHQGFQSVWNLTGGTDAWSAQVDASLPRY